MDLTKLSKEIYNMNKEKGFWEDHSQSTSLANMRDFTPEQVGAIDNAFISQKLMLIVTEVGEAMEALRDFKHSEILKDWHFELEDPEVKERFEKDIKNTFQDEIADSIIRLLDLCGGLDIDIQKHIELKLKYNKTRGYKHGKQF